VRRKNEKTLGPGTKPKHEALKELADYITEHTGKLAKQGESIVKFVELWIAKHVIPQIESQRMRDVMLTPLQLLLNKLAEDGFSKSAVGHIRT